MGRLIEPVSNGRARLMIEAMQMEQNPAYSFAAANNSPFGNGRGFLFLISLC